MLEGAEVACAIARDRQHWLNCWLAGSQGWGNRGAGARCYKRCPVPF